MNLIDRFVEKVRKETDSFVIKIQRDEENKKTYHFMQSKNGNARFVYGDYSYLDEDFYMSVKYKPELCAIVSDNIVYVTNPFFFDIYGKNYPAGVKDYSEYVRSLEKSVEEILFAEYWDGIEICEVDITNASKATKQKARNIVFDEDVIASLEKYKYVKKCPFTDIDYAKVLCGNFIVREEVFSRFDNMKNDFISCKIEFQMLSELINNRVVAEDWELSIANGLNSVDAQTVNVEFEFHGKYGAEKIEPYQLRRILCDRDYFSDFNFCNTKRAGKMIEELGAKTRKYNGEVLTCKHITKITYGKKTLYERKG